MLQITLIFDKHFRIIVFQVVLDVESVAHKAIEIEEKL